MALELPQVRRLTGEKLSTELQRALGEPLIVPLNRFLEPVAALLDRGLSSSNLNAQLLTKTLVMPDDWVRPTLAAGATENAILPLRWRKTTTGEVEGIGQAAVAAAPGTVYTLPWVPIQTLGFASRDAAGNVAILRVLGTGVVEVGNLAGTTVNVMFHFAPTDRTPWTPEGVFGADATFTSTLKGACIGIWPLQVQALDSAGKPTGAAVGGLQCPDWTETLAPDRVTKLLRINNQLGLHPSVTYRITWLALGG